MGPRVPSLRRHVPRCSECGVRGGYTAGLRESDGVLRCRACRARPEAAAAEANGASAAEADGKAGVGACWECGAAAEAGGMGSFCGPCWGDLLRPDDDGERRPCQHCGRLVLTLYGAGDRALCERCRTEAAGVARRHPSLSDEVRQRSSIVCSFCGRPHRQSEMLIAGPTDYLCASCVDLGVWLEQSEREEPAALTPPPCVFCGVSFGERPSFFTTPESSRAVCDACLDLSRELLLEERLAHASTMRHLGHRECATCQRPRGHAQIASGAILCESCGPPRDADRQGPACLWCHRAADTVLLLGPPGDRRCLDCRRAAAGERTVRG